MQTYEMLVENRAVRGNSKDMTLVRTSVGIDTVHVLFDDPEWLMFPVTITFAQGDTVVTHALILSSVDNSEWAAEASCVVPHEVVDMVGAIRVTLQGTDSNGRHIITAKGSPLSVEEAGDVIAGDIPSDAPTPDQWSQVYADAIVAANEAQSLVNNLQQRIDEIVSSAALDVAALMSLGPATKESLGLMQVGNGLSVTEDGVVSSLAVNGITPEQTRALANLSKLAYLCFNAEFDESGVLMDTAAIKPEQFPKASVGNLGTVMPDGTSITVDSDGMIHSVSNMVAHRWNGTVLEVTSTSGTSSADLRGEKGERGERGEQGPPGYVLTEEDVEQISEQVYARYLLGDDVRY